MIACSGWIFFQGLSPLLKHKLVCLSWHIQRNTVFTQFNVENERSALASNSVAGLVANIRRATEIFGKNFQIQSFDFLESQMGIGLCHQRMLSISTSGLSSHQEVQFLHLLGTSELNLLLFDLAAECEDIEIVASIKSGNPISKYLLAFGTGWGFQKRILLGWARPPLGSRALALRAPPSCRPGRQERSSQN